MPFNLLDLFRRGDKQDNVGIDTNNRARGRNRSDLDYAAATEALKPQEQHDMSYTTASPVTRAGFAWRLLGRPSNKSAEQVMTLASAYTDGTRPLECITRVEAAAMANRKAGVDGLPFEGQVYYFHDVFPSAGWMFETAHVARLYGIFHGTQENLFDPAECVDSNVADIIVSRAMSPTLRSKEDQARNLTVQPLTEPNEVDAILSKTELEVADIARARELILGLPVDQRASRYRILQQKVSYRNQRNNKGTGAGDGDYMCNWTSIAMVLNSQGIGGDESKGQFEDQLDAAHKGNRYDKNSRGAEVRGKYGLQDEVLWVSGDKQKWFEQTCLPRLEAGQSAYLGIQPGSYYSLAHIVRLEWVEGEGLRVDDPYGAISWSNGKYRYNHNAKDSEDGKGAKGEDNLWTWDMLPKLMRGGCYLHFMWK